MQRSPRVVSAIFGSLIAIGAGADHVAPGAGPLVFNEKTGHYPDLSYQSLSTAGLSWQQRGSLFGGETIHYGPLSDQQRQLRERELAALLVKIQTRETKVWADPQFASRIETEVRNWLDAQTSQIPAGYRGIGVQDLRTRAVGFLRAYEIFAVDEYLAAGLRCAEVIRSAQWPRGHWPWSTLSENFVRIQDGYNNEPFWIMLYAHKLSGDPKFFESARRCADVVLSLQRENGGWPDQWSFDGRSSGHSGVMHGVSFNDNATNSCFQMMVMMYHLTGDKKYIARLHRLGPFLAKANIGEGKLVGWCEQYNDRAQPVRARQYEIELPYPRALTRAVGPLLIWLYLMDGDEAHIDLLRRAYAWHEHVRQRELDPAVLARWRAMSQVWSPAHHVVTHNYLMEYRPGWPDAWLPDGSNWGRVLRFQLMAWNPVTPRQKEKYGRLIDHAWPPLGELARLARSDQPPPRDYNMYVYCHSSIGNSLSEIRRALLEHKQGGRKGMLEYYSHPTRFTPDQYLLARIDAAKRVLNMRNRRMAYPYAGRPGYTGMSTMGDFRFVATKSRWYGMTGTKWGQAFDSVYPASNAAWYQWQLLYDMKLAAGHIDAVAAARGGRGLETVASSTHLDSWDVLGEWGMAVHPLENYFDVPLLHD